MSEKTLEVLKSGNCPSLSGRSELEFSISCDANNALHLTITSNTGNGLYSKKPMLLSNILPNDDAPFSSGKYQECFKNISINTAGFTLAIFKHLGLIKNVQDNTRSYIRCDPTAFYAAMKELIDGKADPDTPPPKKPAKARKDTTKEISS